jgi:hypothetical protein
MAIIGERSIGRREMAIMLVAKSGIRIILILAEQCSAFRGLAHL